MTSTDSSENTDDRKVFRSGEAFRPIVAALPVRPNRNIRHGARAQMMEWNKLLAKHRVTPSGVVEHVPTDDERFRSVYERDWDRIVFSASFRRMQDKTQVFPLPVDDFVHTRLTHSLEVASVGRSLGRNVGLWLAERGLLPPGIAPGDLAQVVANACLAHDIGNPPFGHAGERAIAEQFERGSCAGEIRSVLSESQMTEFTRFEGNAQGFRILTHLEHEGGGGLKLCAATLGAFMKYPQTIEGTSWKKHGVNSSERAVFDLVCEQVGLDALDANSRSRHPLAFLVEAADDICYSVLDIEDGYRIGLVHDFENRDNGNAWSSLLSVAETAKPFDAKRLASIHGAGEKGGYVRSMAITALTDVAIKSFEDNYEAMIQGRLFSSLIDSSTSRSKHEALLNAARTYLYGSNVVVEPEIAGHAALSGLLDICLPAALAGSEDAAKARGDRTLRAFRLLRGEARLEQADSVYERLLRVTDFISGMTDRHALLIFRKLTATSLPGRFA